MEYAFDINFESMNEISFNRLIESCVIIKAIYGNKNGFEIEHYRSAMCIGRKDYNPMYSSLLVTTHHSLAPFINFNSKKLNLKIILFYI